MEDITTATLPVVLQQEQRRCGCCGPRWGAAALEGKFFSRLASAPSGSAALWLCRLEVEHPEPAESSQCRAALPLWLVGR